MAHRKEYFEGLIDGAIAELTAKGIAREDLAPLDMLKRALEETFPDNTSHTQQPDSTSHTQQKDARQGFPASDELLARVCAVIDLLVQAGESPEYAAQSVSRQLLASGVALPEEGGDARGWKRLLDWRTRLLHGSRHADVKPEYLRFKEALTEIPANQRIRRAIGEQLWNRRRESLKTAQSA